MLKRILYAILIIFMAWLSLSFIEVICKNLDANSTLSNLNFFKIYAGVIL